MALKDVPETKAAATTTPAFETQTETTTMTMTDTPTQAELATAGVEATKAIAVAATTAVGAAKPKVKFEPAFAGHKDVFDTPTVIALSMATPRITAEQGTLNKNRKDDVGKVIVIEPISWNMRTAVGNGTNDKESADFFRVAYDDGVVVGEGCTVAEYLDSLKAQGFTKAKASAYGDLFCYIVQQGGKEIQPEQREMVLVQMSQTSLGAFTSMCVSRGMLQSKGVLPEATLIEITAQATQNGKGDKYTNLSFRAI